MILYSLSRTKYVIALNHSRSYNHAWNETKNTKPQDVHTLENTVNEIVLENDLVIRHLNADKGALCQFDVDKKQRRNDRRDLYTTALAINGKFQEHATSTWTKDKKGQKIATIHTVN
jgi:hypothetical protein